jgi:hypothetical protein
MKWLVETLRFILALFLIIPVGAVVLMGYGGMLIMREILIFLGEWPDE